MNFFWIWNFEPIYMTNQALFEMKNSILYQHFASQIDQNQICFLFAIISNGGKTIQPIFPKITAYLVHGVKIAIFSQTLNNSKRKFSERKGNTWQQIVLNASAIEMITIFLDR